MLGSAKVLFVNAYMVPGMQVNLIPQLEKLDKLEMPSAARPSNGSNGSNGSGHSRNGSKPGDLVYSEG